MEKENSTLHCLNGKWIGVPPICRGLCSTCRNLYKLIKLILPGSNVISIATLSMSLQTFYECSAITYSQFYFFSFQLSDGLFAIILFGCDILKFLLLS